MNQYTIARAALEKKQLGAAERGFMAVLKTTPNHAPSLRDLAVVRFMQNRRDEAVKLGKRAVEAGPNDADNHLQLGEIYTAIKSHDLAFACVERACEVDPASARAWTSLEQGLRLQNRDDDVESRMLAALGEQPTSMGVMLNLGNLYGKRKQYPQALTMFERMLTIDPGSFEARQQRANTLYFLERWDEAIAGYDSALEVSPRLAFAQTQKGNIYIKLKRPQDALNAFALGLEWDSKSYDGLVGMGAVLWELNRLDEALTFLQGALHVQPRGIAAFNNLGQVMAAYKADADAIVMFDRVHEIEPESKMDARLSAATSALRIGRYEDGWKRYESRLLLDRTAIVDTAAYAGVPRWQGEDLTGKTLLIVPEQGFGDTIQFCRYVPLLAHAIKGNVVFAVNAPLLPLLEGKEKEWGPAGNLRIIAHNDHIPSADYFVMLMSLPLLCETRVETIPAAPHYLEVPEKYKRKWAKALPESGKLRIGIAWSGNPGHVNDRNRSMPIEHIAPLVGDTSVDWCVVQPIKTERDRLALRTVLHVFDGGSHIADFGDTAALIDLLDIVVAVDTSVAHLAAAMGKPVFLMLPWAAEWRWFHDRTDSPWYPSMRLFRQPSLGNWDGVIDDVQAALKEFAEYKATIDAIREANMLADTLNRSMSAIH